MTFLFEMAIGGPFPEIRDSVFEYLLNVQLS